MNARSSLRIGPCWTLAVFLLGQTDDSAVHRVRNIVTTVTSGSVKIVSGFTPLNGAALFAGTDDNGIELWRSDGTAAGTRVVSEAQPQFMTEFDGLVYFLGGVDADQLWKTDGTAEGTVLVKQTGPGSGRNLKGIGGLLYFGTANGQGARLWRSDGTPGGTLSVGEFRNEPRFLPPYGFVGFKGATYFFANDAAGVGLWRTDGTASGTAIVENLGDAPGGIGSEPGELTSGSGSLLFVTYEGNLTYRLWRSDGSTEGTSAIRDFVADPRETSPFLLQYVGPSGLTAVNGAVLFAANDGVRGRELWRTDGTAQGTVLVKDIRTGSPGSGAYGLLAAQGRVYFGADDGVSGTELWTSDGTEAGTRIVRDIEIGSAGSSPRPLVAVGATVFFAPQEPPGSPVWRTDGTASGTFALPMPCEPIFADAAGVTLFVSTDCGAVSNLWKSDGTREGTALVSDFPAEGGSFPSDLTPVARRIFFSAAGRLWASDGTESGTVALFQAPPAFEVLSGAFATRSDDLYFLADDGVNGRHVWKSNGSRSGMIGTGALNPFSLTATSDLVFFAAFDRDHGHELWRTDGTEAGTALVRDIRPGSFSSLAVSTDSVTAQPWLAVGRWLFFSADDGTHGLELWKSDGTEAGTQMVKDIRPGSGQSSPYELTASNGAVFFAADDGGGFALWKSDGAEAGTQKVSDVTPDRVPRTMTASGGLVYFTVNGDELWRSSGTPQGTFRIKQISAHGLTNVRGTLFFAGDDGTSGSELWKSDGTAAGTVLVKDILPGPPGSNPSCLADAGGILLFAANDGLHGTELWRSDGTRAGTFLRQDINPGPSSSLPLSLTRAGPYVYFSADDGVSGRELWAATAYDARLLPFGLRPSPSPLSFRR